MKPAFVFHSSISASKSLHHLYRMGSKTNIHFASKLSLKTFWLLLLLWQQHSFSQIKNIWALGDGEKVFRDDRNHPDKNGNFTWDGKAIHLKGLYNEVLAFQVIVETGVAPAKGIELSIGALAN